MINLIKKPLAGLFAAILLLTACATPYQQKGFRGGYEEVNYRQNVAEITFEGNAFTGSDFVRRAVLLRAAEYTIESDYRWFVPLDSNQRTSTGAFVNPSQSQTSVTAHGNTATATTYRTPAYVTPVSKHKSVILIRMGRGPAPQGAIIADEIVRNLGDDIR